MAEKQKLIDSVVRDALPPAAGTKDYARGYSIVWDSDITGFALRITRAGAKAWVFSYRADGVEYRMTIGQVSTAWNAGRARVRAGELRRAVDLGGNPKRDEDERAAAPTIDELADRYTAEHLPRKRPSSQEGDRLAIEKWIKPELGRLKVAAVRHADIANLHRKISDAGSPVRANRVIALVSKMLSLAVKWEMRPDNPARGVERNPEERRQRYLSPAELQRLSVALDAHKNQSSANAVRLLLLTGARRGEVLGATWPQFDLEAGVWVKPSAHTKQKKQHRAPLSAPAMQLLVSMRAGETARAKKDGREPDEALFPGRGAAETQRDLKKFWHSVCKTAEIGEARIHDCRHTFAAILASAGMSLPIIGALLGHTQPGTTMRYAHLADDPLRQAAERVSTALAAAASGKTADVRTMKRGQS